MSSLTPLKSRGAAPIIIASAPDKASYELIRGPMEQSLLATDGYKFSMAEAG